MFSMPVWLWCPSVIAMARSSTPNLHTGEVETLTKAMADMCKTGVIVLNMVESCRAMLTALVPD